MSKVTELSTKTVSRILKQSRKTYYDPTNEVIFLWSTDDVQGFSDVELTHEQCLEGLNWLMDEYHDHHAEYESLQQYVYSLSKK